MAKAKVERLDVPLARMKWQDSGISEDTAKKLHLAGLSRAETQALGPTFAAVESLQIPYFDLDGELTEFYRVRYLEALPGFSGLARKPQRYAQAPGSLNEVYLPPLLPPSWREVVKNTSTPIIITEGELKAAAGCAAGLPVMGLGGVDVWRSAKRGMELLPTLLETEWRGREIYILFDSDTATNPDVVRAQRQLARALLNRGAKPKIVALPPGPAGQKQGLDDYLIGRIAKDVEELLVEAPPFEEGDALWELNEEVIFIRDPGIVVALDDSQRMDPHAFAASIFANRHYTEVITDPKGKEKRSRKPLAPRWLKWEVRNEARRMTYQPGKDRRYGDGYNAWQGWGCEPKAGDIQPWHDLVGFLFKNDLQALEWFEKWLAYPIQYPGSKLLTAAVLYGTYKGTGKTFVAYLMGDIYGQNFVEIENAHLRGSFNAWAINRQFVYGDEITGGEARVDADKLKRIITRETISINQKFIPEYTLPDCINYLISSNHPDAIFLEDGDRRYFIHEVEGGPCTTPGFYDRLDAWRKAGGAAALFDYLLKLDLTGFNPRANAPPTHAKAQMTLAGKSDLGAWVAHLREDPVTSLRVLGDRVASECDLFSPTILLRAYDPDERRKMTAQALARELQRAGFRPVNCGGTIRTKMGTQRLYAVRNLEKWRDVSMKVAAEHFDKFFGPVAGKF
jgi:hypothetical protein